MFLLLLLLFLDKFKIPNISQNTFVFLTAQVVECHATIFFFFFHYNYHEKHSTRKWNDFVGKIERRPNNYIITITLKSTDNIYILLFRYKLLLLLHNYFLRRFYKSRNNWLVSSGTITVFLNIFIVWKKPWRFFFFFEVFIIK